MALVTFLMSCAFIVFFVYIINTDIIVFGSGFSESNNTWKDFADVYAYLLAPLVGLLGFAGIIMTIMSQERSSNKELAYSYLVELTKIYCDIRNNMSVGGESGISIFPGLLSEWHCIYKLIAKSDLAQGLSSSELIDMSFVFFYFGTNEKAMSYYGEFPKIKDVSDLIARKEYKDDSGKTHKRHKGHQDKLGHYFRFLYNAFGFIQNNEHISDVEKKNLGKLLRSSVSTYELALIAINCKSKLGNMWVKTGKVEYFNLFTNIPEYFFTKNDVGFTVKELYPEVQYDWDEQS